MASVEEVKQWINLHYNLMGTHCPTKGLEDELIRKALLSAPVFDEDKGTATRYATKNIGEKGTIITIGIEKKDSRVINVWYILDFPDKLREEYPNYRRQDDSSFT